MPEVQKSLLEFTPPTSRPEKAPQGLDWRAKAFDFAGTCPVNFGSFEPTPELWESLKKTICSGRL